MRASTALCGAFLVACAMVLFACNEPVELAPIGDRAVNAGSELRFEVLGFDPDGDDLDYWVENLPPGASFDAGARTFAWTPSYDQWGIYEDIVFYVSDGEHQDSEAIDIFVIEVETDYSDEVVEIADEQAEEAALEPDRVVFPSEGNEELLDLNSGDIIVSDYETGFLRRVSEVQETDGEIVVLTDPASIEELYKYANLSTTVELEGENDAPWVNWDFSHTVLIDNPEGIPLRVEITDGQFIMEPVVEMDLHISGFPPQVDSFYFAMGGQASFDVKVEAIAGGSIDWADEQVLPLVTMTPFVIPNTPIVIVPQLNLILGAQAHLSAQATAEAGISANSLILAGVRYQFGAWENVEVQDFDFYHFGPVVSADVSAELEGHARLEIKFLFFNVAGPYLQVGPYAWLMAELYPECYLQLDAGVDGYVGIDLETLWPAGEILHWQLFNLRETLYYEECSW